MLWAFARVLGDFRAEFQFLKEHGVTESTMTDPDGRISLALAAELLRRSAERVGDPALGLHAGERTEGADWGTLHFLGRNCVDFRGALACGARYMGLVDDLTTVTLTEEGTVARWQVAYRVPRSPIANDFQAAATLATFARTLGRQEPPIEVHLAHPVATDAREYARVFRAPVRLGAEHNAIIFSRALLDAKLPQANPDLFEPFNQQAQRLLDSLSKAQNTTYRVQRLIVEGLGGSPVGMEDVAKRLYMSPATLRRRLAEEETTYQDLLDRIRHDLAMRHIENPRLAITEIACLLGFSTVSAFGRAFRRWTGMTPADHRAMLRRRNSEAAMRSPSVGGPH